MYASIAGSIVTAAKLQRELQFFLSLYHADRPHTALKGGNRLRIKTLINASSLSGTIVGTSAAGVFGDWATPRMSRRILWLS